MSKSAFIHKAIKEGKYSRGTMGMLCWRISMNTGTKPCSQIYSTNKIEKRTLRNDFVTCPICIDISRLMSYGIIKNGIIKNGVVINSRLFSEDVEKLYYKNRIYFSYNSVTRVYSIKFKQLEELGSIYLFYIIDKINMFFKEDTWPSGFIRAREDGHCI